MSIRRALATFYVFIGLRWFRLTGAIWILYLVHVGWPLWQVGIAEGIFHVVGFLSALPTGAYADRMGRRRSLIVGLLIAVVSGPMTFFMAPVSRVGGMAAMGLSSLSWSFISGADHALLYDLAKGLPDPDRVFARILGRADAVALVSGAVAAVLGGLMAVHWGWQWPYFLAAAAEALAIPAVLALPKRIEARIHGMDPKPGFHTVLSTLREIRDLTQTKASFLGLILFGAVLGVVATSNHLYAQTTLVTKGETVVAASVTIAVGGLLAALASTLSHRLPTGRGTASLLRLGATLLALALVGVGSSLGVWAALAFWASGFVDGGLDILYVTELSRSSPDALRATVLSAPDTLFSLGMILCFSAEGWAMTRFGLPPVYAGLAVLLVLATTLTLRQDHRTRTDPKSVHAGT